MVAQDANHLLSLRFQMIMACPRFLEIREILSSSCTRPAMTTFFCTQDCAVQTALVGSLQVLTAGIDGQLHLLPMQWEQGSETSTSHQTCYSDEGGYVSYYDAQWASIDTFVTASTTGWSCI